MSTKRNYSSAVSLLIIIATIYWSFSSLMSHKITTLKTPVNEFSTERALVHLKEISKNPHYVGTQNHTEVRNYIIKELENLGLTVEIQTQTAINKKWRSGAETKNILAKIEGSEPGKALLLLSHYDSAVHSSFGASDAGSGVVTILEGVRAFLANNKQPKNDIIILISDAEELGLLGANAFVNHHPWAKEVQLALNFEARGSGGPSYMLVETNGGNKNLVKAFNKANPKYPVASSLMYSVYKMLPNDMDLTVLREDANINGYNFAFIDDHFDYHTSQDSYARLDRNTLQHQADYLMPLLNYFADASLDNLSAEEDFVYFNFPFFKLIYYPFSWVYPLLIISFMIFVVFIIYGFKKRNLILKQILIGFLPLLLALIISGLLAVFGWKLILKIHPQYQDILHGFTYNGNYYITAFVAITLSISFFIYNKYFRKNSILNLLVAPIFLWLILNYAIAVYLQGGGFFILPVITTLIVFGILLFSKKSQHNRVVLFSLLFIPCLLIIVPLIQMFPVGLGLKMLVISSVLTVLIISLMIPVFHYYKNIKILTFFFLLVGILSLVSAAFTSGYSVDRKEPNSILYVLNADQKEAFWASYNRETDDFTEQYLGENPNEGSFVKNPSASKYGTSFKLHKKTEVIALPEPLIAVYQDTTIGEHRIINVKITPQRRVNRIELLCENVLHFSSFTINGESISAKKGEEFIFDTEKRKHVLSFYFAENSTSLDLEFTILKDDKPVFEMYEASYDVFTNPLINSLTGEINSRSEIMMPMPFILNDAVVIIKKIEF